MSQKLLTELAVGLYEVASSGGLPGLGIMMTCAIFHWIGNECVRNITLKKYR